MKSTGIDRKVDELGRMVIPKELRDILGIDVKTPLEIFVDGETIILKKYNPGCTICGSMDDVEYFKGQRICRECIDFVKNNG